MTLTDEDVSPLLSRFDPQFGRPAFYIGKGWYPIVIALDAAISLLDPNYTLMQVKEKFGGLRYYWAPSASLPPVTRERILAMVQLAENLSYAICEECGRAGSLVDNRNWLRTLCPDCEQETRR